MGIILFVNMKTMWMRRGILMALAALCLCGPAAGGPPWLSSRWISSYSYGQVHIVVADAAPALEKLAAQEFAAYWKQATGHDAPVNATPPDNREALKIWIGAQGVPDALMAQANIQGLGAEGYCIRSLTADGPNLLLVGGGERGTLYAVYHFFEQYLGVRWLTPSVTYIPPTPPPTLPEIQVRYQPPFMYRQTGYIDAKRDEAFARTSRQFAPEWGLSGFSAYELVPPETYATSHAEYYAQVDGKPVFPADFDWRDPVARQGRSAHLGQLNYANPEVAGLMAGELSRRIASAPGALYWSLWPMDWGNFDQGPQSRTIDDSEGTPMGSLLTCVNRVAEHLARERPGYFVETLARGAARKAPRRTRPAENVAVRVCNADCDFSSALDKSTAPANARFLADLADWSRITGTLFVWEHTANYRNYQTPHPNLHVLAENMRIYAKYGVKGVFDEGCPEPGGEFAELRAYVVARCMWDPSVDSLATAHEFIDLYYGKAAPKIKEYLALLTQKVSVDRVFMGARDDGRWLDYDLVSQLEGLFRQAIEAADTPETKARVEQARLPVQYAALVCPPRVRFTRTEVSVLRPPSVTLDQYLGLLRGAGYTQVAPQMTVDRFAERMEKNIPARSQTLPLQRLESRELEVWIVPEAAGAVIRMHHIGSNAELLEGFRSMRTGVVQEWVHAPGAVEGPAAPIYEVSARDLDSVTLKASLKSGLTLERKMTVKRGESVIMVDITLRNPTSSAVSPRLRLHTEFSAPAAKAPEIWAEQSGRWVQLNADKPVDVLVHRAYVDPGPCRAWAACINGQPAHVINRFDASQVGALLYDYDVEENSRIVSLDLVFPEDPIPSGGQMQMQTSYELTMRHPSK